MKDDIGVDFRLNSWIHTFADPDENSDFVTCGVEYLGFFVCWWYDYLTDCPGNQPRLGPFLRYQMDSPEGGQVEDVVYQECADGVYLCLHAKDQEG